MTQAHLNVYDFEESAKWVGEAEPAEFTFDESLLVGRVLELFLSQGYSVVPQDGACFFYEGASQVVITNVGDMLPGWRLERVDPAFPLSHRMDLPEHERAISGESLRLMRKGIAEARAGKLTAVPASVFEDDGDDE